MLGCKDKLTSGVLEGETCGNSMTSDNFSGYTFSNQVTLVIRPPLGLEFSDSAICVELLIFTSGDNASG